MGRELEQHRASSSQSFIIISPVIISIICHNINHVFCHNLDVHKMTLVNIICVVYTAFTTCLNFKERANVVMVPTLQQQGQ
jgi:hypothetical protein